MKLKSFFKQCHNKEVFKMLSIYVVSAWVILQVLSITWQPLGLPQKSVTFLIIALLIGFPLYIFLLWKFSLAPLEKAQLELEEDGSKKKSGFQKMYFSSLGIISILCAVTVFLIVTNNFSQATELPTLAESDKIAVLKFGNNTGDPKYDIVSKMTADWITHGITENKAGQVISQEVINDYNDHLKKNKKYENEDAVVKEYFRPGKIISGNFYLNGGKLLFQCALKDGNTDKTIIAFKPTESDPDSPLEGIDDLKESIIGYLMTKDHKREMLQEIPPKYDAYQFLLEAKASSDNEEYIVLLNKAIAADSNYFEPKVLRVGYYFSIEKYKMADSLLKSIKPVSHQNKRQINLLNMYAAMLNGNNKRVYQAMMEEYNFAPWDLKSNSSAMTATLQFVNRPENVDEIYRAIKMDSLEIQNCPDCMDRLYVKAYSDIELKNYTSAINILEPILENNNINFLTRPLLSAYIRSNAIEKVDSLLNKLEYTISSENYQELALSAGTEFLLTDNPSNAHVYFEKIIKSNKEHSDKLVLAKALYYKKNYAETEKILQDLEKKNPKNIEVLGRLTLAHYKNNNMGDAHKSLEKLEQLRGDFQYGEIDYALAQFYAISQNETKMYDYLLKAVAAGKVYTPRAFQNDPIFKEYWATKKFQEIMAFWH